MRMLIALTVAVLAIFGAAVSRLIADDIRAWVPRLIELLIARAIRNLPADKRERYHEEWLGNVSEVPGDLSKLLYSLGLLPASWSMRKIAGSATRSTVALSSRVTDVCDVLVAVLMLIFLAPMFAMVALIIGASGGPIFVAHRRVGYRGQPFNCLKFRTMVENSDQVLRVRLASDPALAKEWARAGKFPNDPRMTRIGRLLGETGLDGLPQLINVMRRQMSLVGPRPITESEARRYGDKIEHYHLTRPGITGLRQVSERSDAPYAERAKLDEFYAKNRSIRLYLLILFRTVLRGFGG